MKSFLMASLVLVSGFSLADDLRPGRFVQPVQINSVKVELVGRGFPETKVTAKATFANKCYVPQEQELVSMMLYSKDFSQLNIALGSEIEGACPEIYAPVTVTIDLGRFTRPNDGSFRKVTVNGVVGKKTAN